MNEKQKRLHKVFRDFVQLFKRINISGKGFDVKGDNGFE